MSADVQKIRGMFVPVPTPFDGEGELDSELYGSMCDYYVDKGSNALFLLGSVGQGPSMRIDQRKKALEVAVSAVGNRVPVVPNVGAVDPYTASELAVHAKKMGVPAIAMVGPYYYSDRSEDEIISHISMIDKSAGLPLFIYDNPKYQGYSMHPAFMARIKDRVPNVFGVKIAKGGINDILRYQAAMGSEFKLFAPQQNLFPGMLVGQTGSVSPPLTMAIEVGIALVEAIDKGDLEYALEIQKGIFKFSQTLDKFDKYGRSVQREGLRYAGFPIKQYPRWPTVEIPKDELPILYKCIDEVKNVLRESSLVSG